MIACSRDGIALPKRTQIQTLGTTAEWRSQVIREFAGRAGGRARYIKEVDVNERTIRFAQEIFDASGRLVAMHEKFPVDLGHKEL